jgi:hypothetical protein
LSVHQRVAPLKTRLDKFGSGPIAGATTITIDEVTIQGMATVGTDDLDDAFVPGQFFEMTDDEKFKRPAFERLPAGVKVKTSAFLTATAQKADQHYVTITIDNLERLPEDDGPGALSAAYRVSGGVRASMAEFAAAARSEFSREGRYAAPSQGIAMTEPGWAIAGRDDLSPQSVHATYTAAAARAAEGNGAGVQIVSDFEAVGA